MHAALTFDDNLLMASDGVKRALGSMANDVSHHAPCGVYIAKTT